MLNKAAKRLAIWSPLFIRFALGIVIAAHGAQKLFGAFDGPGISGFAGYLAKLGVPVPVLFSPIVALVEFFGGIAILLGFLTRPAALLIAIDMLVAILMVHAPKGFFVSKGGLEFAFVNLCMALFLLFNGPGARCSIDE